MSKVVRVACAGWIAALGWLGATEVWAQADFTASVMGGVMAGLSGQRRGPFPPRCKPETRTPPAEWLAQNNPAVDALVTRAFAAWSAGDRDGLARGFRFAGKHNIRLADGTKLRAAKTEAPGPAGTPHRLWTVFAGDEGAARTAWRVGAKSYVIDLGGRPHAVAADKWQIIQVLETSDPQALSRPQPYCDVSNLAALW